jgi:hypothetical protein
MPYGPVKIFSGSVVSGASTLTSIDISKSWNRVYLEVGTMSTAATIGIYASQDNSTFRPVYERTKTAPVQYQLLEVTTGIGSSGGFADLKAQFPQYLQFRCGAVVSGGVSLSVVCCD